jgi:BlaI family penicillinase repressor
LTRVESEIMRVLWDKQLATVHEVVAALPRTFAYTSALTVLRILEKKGYVTHEAHPEGGRAHVYRPLVPATKARRQHVRDLVDRLFSGQPAQLVVGLLEEEALTPEELERMRAVIESRLTKPTEPSVAPLPDKRKRATQGTSKKGSRER